jgi:hypothetical protein
MCIDGSFYGSYQNSLYYMYDKVPVNGIVIFDDVFTAGWTSRRNTCCRRS